MKKAHALFPIFLIGLAACTPLVDNADRAAIDVKETAIAVQERVIGYFTYVPTPKHEPYVQPRYCYKTYQDIVCYSEPVQGEESRLVGWQGGYAAPARAAPSAGPEVPVMNAAEPPPLEPVIVGDTAVAGSDEPAAKISLPPGQPLLY